MSDYRKLHARLWIEDLVLPKAQSAEELQELLIPEELAEQHFKVYTSRFPFAAHELLGSVLCILVWLRDRWGWKLNGELLARSLTIDGLLCLVCLPGVPKDISARLRDFCETAFSWKFDLASMPYSVLAEVERRAKSTRNPSEAGRTLRKKTGWTMIDNWIIQFHYVIMTLCRMVKDTTSPIQDAGATA